MRHLLTLCFLTLALAAHAQSTEAALKTRLLHQPLYLQHDWADDKLHFDSAGRVTGKLQLTSFTLCGIEIKSLKLTATELQLTGLRVGLEFTNAGPKRVTLQAPNGLLPGTHDEEMKLAIDMPAGGDYGPALDAMFTDKLADLVPRMPLEWQSYATTHLLGQVPADDPAQPKVHDVRRVGGGVKAPIVLSAPEPQFTNQARYLRHSGTVLVYLQVDHDGLPVKLRLIRPLGLGLDEQALLAVRRYKFKPATENGKPVGVEMNVEVNFQIF